MAALAHHRAGRSKDADDRLDCTVSQPHSFPVTAGRQGGKKGNWRDIAFVRAGLTPQATPATVAVSSVAFLEPCKSFLKSLVVAPTQLCEPLQHPGSEPRHRRAALSSRESSLAQCVLEDHFGRRLKPRIRRICAPLDCRQKTPTGSGIGSPQGHVGRPCSVRKEIRNQRRDRLTAIGTTACANHSRALDRTSYQLDKNPPMEVGTMWVEQPGKRITAKSLPGVLTDGHSNASGATQLNGIPQHPQRALDPRNPAVSGLEGRLIIEIDDLTTRITETFVELELKGRHLLEAQSLERHLGHQGESVADLPRHCRC